MSDSTTKSTQRRASSRLQQKGTGPQRAEPNDVDSDNSTTSATPQPMNTRKKKKVARSNTRAPAAAKLDADTVSSTMGAAKQKAVWAKVRGRRGQLKLVVEMPFDILLEVFQYLPPVDLLCLTRASKSLRALLLDRATAYPLWKFAFDSLDPAPPPCPDDLNLPQYANLLFTKTCFHCDNHIREVTRTWAYYLVTCRSCFERLFFLPPRSPERGQISRILTGLGVDGKNRYSNQDSFYLKSEYERHKTALNALESDVDRVKYVADESQKLSGRRNFLRELRNWEDHQALLKSKSIIDRRKNRTEAIHEKIKELGYSDVLETLNPWNRSSLPHTKGVKPLTDREWEKIKPELIAALEQKRWDTKVGDRRNLLRARTTSLQSVYRYYISHNRSIAHVSPSCAEVAKTEPFRTMIYDTPGDKTLTHADFLAHLDKLPEICESWRDRTTAFLLGLIPQETESTETSSGKAKKGSRAKGKEKATLRAGEAILDLATTLFGCNACIAILPYHRALSHSCFTLSKEENRTVEQSADPNSCWNETGAAKYHQAASSSAREIITILGKDPQTAIGRELDDARQRLECVRCFSQTPAGRNKRVIMDWRNAVSHDVLHHQSSSGQGGATKWKLVEGKSLTAVYKKETGETAPGNERWRSMRCIECDLWKLDEKKSQVAPNTANWLLSQRRLALGERCIFQHDMGTYSVDTPGFTSTNPYTVTLY